MEENIKKLVKNINRGKDLNNNLPIYLNTLEKCYYKNACIHSALEYYTLYEVINEDENADLDEIQEVLLVLQEAVEVLCSDVTDKTVIYKKLEENRNEIMKKMDVLTAYIDIIQIYEYVLNRLEYRYKEYTQADEELFINKVVQYIFQVKDNTVINENIKEVIGQLPIRMTKSKFFQLLKNSLTLYNGSDKASVETYLYMLRTSSMLYQPEGMESAFPKFADLIEELKHTDYKEMSKEKFNFLHEKIENAANQLFGITDLFVMVQSILNCFCVLALCEKKETSNENTAETILLQVNRKFKEKGEFSREPYSMEELEKSLVSLEGVQESLSEEILSLETVLFEINHEWKKELNELELLKKAEALERMEKLLSSSIFVDLEEQENNSLADNIYLERKADEFIEELMELFQNNPMNVNRAVMAAVLNKMPVFFESSEEVMDYVKNSFNSCRDEEEKQAVIEILETMMTE